MPVLGVVDVTHAPPWHVWSDGQSLVEEHGITAGIATQAPLTQVCVGKHAGEHPDGGGGGEITHLPVLRSHDMPAGHGCVAEQGTTTG